MLFSLSAKECRVISSVLEFSTFSRFSNRHKHVGQEFPKRLYVIFQKFEHMNISRQLISSTAMAEFSGEFVKVSEPSPHILLVELNRHVHLFDSKNGMQIVELVQKAGECFLQRVCPRFF